MILPRMMAWKCALRVVAVGAICLVAIAAPAAADDPAECYRAWNPDAQS